MSFGPIVVNMGVESTEQTFQGSVESEPRNIPMSSVTEVIRGGGSDYRLAFTDPDGDGNVVISEVWNAPRL